MLHYSAIAIFKICRLTRLCYWCISLKIMHMSWASYQIRKIAGCACAGNAGNVFPRRRFQTKPLVSDPGMHHGTCVTHVPWCMSGSLTCGDGKTFPAFPAHAHPQFCVSDKRPMACLIQASVKINVVIRSSPNRLVTSLKWAYVCAHVKVEGI